MGKVIRNKGERMTSFDTHDTGMAIALLCKGHKIIAIHADMNCEDESSVYHFFFTPSIERDAEAFMNDKLLINSKLLYLKMYALSARTDEIYYDAAN